ncbi:hypothetical protein KFL_005810050 [Klebsormidium nitens]|uniref:Fcf2 pre-rRNA processing C-terminal domain-containing protein n=1 Tax=Klebsormidium nitens TaxID=105231 RepID=A0A1Y1IIN8_KLENI|nr:hypothetical protein KFL_005810050 [Klebsormidium nitens]|eukprot:GAQ89952.1 hypothetical protein KFL_005810050 [Klebsormidium nitens]
MASTSGRDEEEDSLLDLMASAMINQLKAKDRGKKVQKTGSKQTLEGAAGQKGGEANFISAKDEDEAALEAALASKQLSWMPDLGLVASSEGTGLKSGQLESNKKLLKIPSLIEKDGPLPLRNPRKERREAQKAKAQTAGPKWFDLPATPITPEVKRDFRLLKLRGVLDPKRHYKAPDSTKFPKYFQIGTVVEGPTEFYSGRLTKSERKPSLTAELLADDKLKSYRKRKYGEIQQEKESGGKKWFKKKKNKQKPNWARS